jgi:pyridoxal 5'-phosphate synthase pdxT subunit
MLSALRVEEVEHMARIGVLAVQGAFEAHARVLGRLGSEPVLVRAAADLTQLGGMILPGGESTVQLSLLERLELEQPLLAAIARGLPVLATCAGVILLARHVTQPEQRSFGLLDVSVQRNGFGRQLDSFEACADDSDLPLVFIRAPRIVDVGAGVEVLARHRGEPVLVRQHNLVGATFHPELTGDDRVHRQVFAAAIGGLKSG